MNPMFDKNGNLSRSIGLVSESVKSLHDQLGGIINLSSDFFPDPQYDRDNQQNYLDSFVQARSSLYQTMCMLQSLGQAIGQMKEDQESINSGREPDPMPEKIKF